MRGLTPCGWPVRSRRKTDPSFAILHWRSGPLLPIGNSEGPTTALGHRHDRSSRSRSPLRETHDASVFHSACRKDQPPGMRPRTRRPHGAHSDRSLDIREESAYGLLKRCTVQLSLGFDAPCGWRVESGSVSRFETRFRSVRHPPAAQRACFSIRAACSHGTAGNRGRGCSPRDIRFSPPLV